MNTETTRCACTSCPGASCACGCQDTAPAATACQCGCQQDNPCHCGSR